MSLLVTLLAAAGILVWPERFGRRRLMVLPGGSRASAGSAPASRSAVASAFRRAGWLLVRRGKPGRSPDSVTAADLLSLLEAIAPALEAGVAPAAALGMAADDRSSAGHRDHLTTVVSGMASAAADGATLGPQWRTAAQSTGSAELRLLAHAWSLTEDMGAPLAQAVRTTAGMVAARIAHERRLAGAVAGAKATVNLLTVLPIGGPLLALVLGIGPAELYADSRLTQGSLLLGLSLSALGRWWVHRMVGAVARGPLIS